MSAPFGEPRSAFEIVLFRDVRQNVPRSASFEVQELCELAPAASATGAEWNRLHGGRAKPLAPLGSSTAGGEDLGVVDVGDHRWAGWAAATVGETPYSVCTRRSRAMTSWTGRASGGV